jgi:hypothetical protein
MRAAVAVHRLNAMNEIWVPSQWQLESFAASGVTREKLVVVPEVRTVSLLCTLETVGTVRMCIGARPSSQ